MMPDPILYCNICHTAMVDCGVVIRRGMRYRIYPTSEQVARIDQWSSALRWLWNSANEQRLMGLAHARGDRKYYTAFDQARELTGLRAELPWLADVPRNVSMQLLSDLYQAWQRFFQGIAGKPHWKKGGRDVLSLTEPHPIAWRIDDAGLHFLKLGVIRIVQHRQLVGKRKTCTLKRDGDQWFASISCEIEVADPVNSTKNPIGIDRGCVNLLADSDGRIVENPRHLRKMQPRITRAQRAMSRRKNGSKNRNKAKLRVARLHRKVRRQRNHVLHCESKRYAESQGIIFVERLNLKGMASAGGAHKKGLSDSLMSSGIGAFVSMCRYKVIPRGGRVVDVPAHFTSQKCRMCGHTSTKNRASQAVFRCMACGHTEHADTHASKNILDRGMSIIAVEPTVTVCGGLAEVGHPTKQKLRVTRRGPRNAR